MLVVVKTPRIEITGKGEFPAKVLKVLKDVFGEKVQISDDSVDWFKTKEHKEIRKSMKPGHVVRIYRENAGFTQPQLAKVTGLSKQVISDIENHRRPMTLKRAEVFSKALNISIERIVHPTRS